MHDPVPDAHVLELIELIYAAAQQPSGWQRFVNGFAQALNGLPAALMVRSRAAEAGGSAVHAVISPSPISDHLKGHADSSPWIRALPLVEPGVSFAIDDLVPLETIKDTGFYRNFMKPNGIGGGFGIKLWDRLDGRCLFFVMCAEDQVSALKPKVMPTLDRLSPHMQRAISICWALRRERVRGLEEGLSRLSEAVFVVNDRREVIFMNKAGAQAAEEGVVRIDNATRMLRLEARKDAAALDDMFRSVSAARRGSGDGTGSNGARGLMTLSGSNGHGLVLLELVPAPIRDEDEISTMFFDRMKEPHALIAMRRRGNLRVPTVEDIRTVFGLSQKEAEVTLALLEGKSVEEYSKLHDVAAETVRWHLKNIYRRTDCGSQAELVRLVLSMIGSVGVS